MSENKIYYIEGSVENPEGVKRALLEACPDVFNINTFQYENDGDLYYVINNRVDYAFDKSHKMLIREIGTELQPVVVKAPIQFRLPTVEDFKKLNKHFSRWNSDCLEILNNASKILTFPAMGYSVGTSNFGVGNEGHYWSSTAVENDSEYAFSVYFRDNCQSAAVCGCDTRYSVRLVSDEPFEGGVEFDGVWWKPENEDGYYSYEEAMNKFNNK